MPFDITVLNVSITLAGIFLCLLGMAQIRLTYRSGQLTSRYFLLFFCFLLVFALSNLTGLLLRGQAGSFVRGILLVSNYLELSFSCVLAYMAPRYYLSVLDPQKQKKALRIAFASLLGIHLLLVLISQFTGLLYVIDENNVYRRSSGFPLALLMPFSILLLSAFLLTHEKEKISRRGRVSFWLFLIVPGIAMTLQLFFYGINLVVLASVLVAIFIYMMIFSDQAEQAEAQTRELNELKVTILTQQIQPHFIYNTMNTAYLLSENHPEQARTLIQDFMTYLKSNISTLSSTRPIPFEEELATTRAFGNILLTRYRNRFTVEYDLACTDFLLPALTIQPLVENAIKHGVLQSSEPDRKVIVRSAEQDSFWEVSVEDNGPGLDKKAVPRGEGTHIGLENVRERLQHISGGTLSIESEAGKGTKIIIRIPKG